MIERLYVQNFRCLESVTLDFAGTPSALLIGKNGAGKSATREAISVFQSICRGSSRVGRLIEPGDFSYLRTDRPMRFEIEATLAGKRFRYAIAFDWPASFHEARIIDESLSVDGQAIFTRQQAQVHLPGGADFGLDWHIFALSVINERPPGRAVADLKAFLASIVLIAPIPARMTGFSEQPSVELEHDASNFASCLRALLVKKPASYGAFDAYVKEVIPDFSSIDHEDRGKDGQQLMVTFKRSESDDVLRVEFDALSDGEKCFFLSAYVIASNAAGFPVVCVWDEPDNHLSLSEVGQFITGLRKMANRGGQFIATSHHPETVRKFSDETTFVLTRKSHLDPTLPKLLKDLTYHGDLIDALIRDEVIG
ncbi:MAG TPA: AAA family ATPase [Tepidisphaeraceae bacterium]|jgi:predicted ATPase|nr:AAA family ATPase [Tepidisphaeraceae bacterium]